MSCMFYLRLVPPASYLAGNPVKKLSDSSPQEFFRNFFEYSKAAGGTESSCQTKSQSH